MSDITNPALYNVREKLAQLEAALIANQPDITQLLRTIHTQLKQDEEIVTVLTEEECSILVSGLIKKTKLEIAAKMLKSKPKTKKALANLSEDDF